MQTLTYKISRALTFDNAIACGAIALVASAIATVAHMPVVTTFATIAVALAVAWHVAERTTIARYRAATAVLTGQTADDRRNQRNARKRARRASALYRVKTAVTDRLAHVALPSLPGPTVAVTVIAVDVSTSDPAVARVARALCASGAKPSLHQIQRKIALPDGRSVTRTYMQIRARCSQTQMDAVARTVWQIRSVSSDRIAIAALGRTITV